MRELVGPHLELEENTITEELLKKHFKPEEEARLLSQVEKHARGHVKVAAVEFPLLLYALHPENERPIFLAKMPWIMRKFVIPYFFVGKCRKLGVLDLLVYPPPVGAKM